MLRLASVALGALVVVGCAQRADESPLVSDDDRTSPSSVEGISVLDGVAPRRSFAPTHRAVG